MRSRIQGRTPAALTLLILFMVAATYAGQSSPSDGAVLMTVRNRRGPLLERPDMVGGRVLRMLDEGDVVVVVDPKQAAKVKTQIGKPSKPVKGKRRKPEIVWYRVSPLGAPSVTGYMHHTVLVPGRLTIDPMQAISAEASGEEVVLAGRGFDEAVERAYIRANSQLAGAFALLDAMETRPRYNPTADEVERFVAFGRATSAFAGHAAAGEVSP